MRTLRERRRKGNLMYRDFKRLSLAQMGARTQDVVETRWVLACKEVGGKETARARLAAKGSEDPDLKDGFADTAGCARGRSSQSQLISSGAPKKWGIWSLDI